MSNYVLRMCDGCGTDIAAQRHERTGVIFCEFCKESGQTEERAVQRDEPWPKAIGSWKRRTGEMHGFGRKA